MYFTNKYENFLTNINKKKVIVALQRRAVKIFRANAFIKKKVGWNN